MIKSLQLAIQVFKALRVNHGHFDFSPEDKDDDTIYYLELDVLNITLLILYLNSL